VRKLPVALALIALLLVAAIAWVLSWPAFGGAPLEGERLARARANPQFRDGRFVNVVPQAQRQWSDTWTMLHEQFTGTQQRIPPAPLPVRALDVAALQAPPAPGLRAFWIGHASVYVELDGLRLLVDPVFSEYASPVEVGPRRFQPPPLRLDELPRIDAVLITHDHYDHLDMATVRQLAARGSSFYVPLGIGAHLDRWGVPAAQVHELEWGQERALRGVRIVATPSRHYSGRSLRDGNATLWSSWSVLGARQRFYVSGDTGWSDHFQEIGARHGPFDLAFIKVGAYGPGDSWRDIHMSAEDAVRAHVALRARRLFPVHWGTFNLAFHAWDEPIRRTVAAARAANVELVTPRLGEIVDAERPAGVDAWWEALR